MYGAYWRAPLMNIDGRCTGGDLPALVGQYVVPNHGCPPEIEEDAAGMAGCITRIIRSDGRVETDIKEHMDAETNCETADGAERMAGGGRDIVFVRWSVDGVERGCHDAHTFLANLRLLLSLTTHREINVRSLLLRACSDTSDH